MIPIPSVSEPVGERAGSLSPVWFRFFDLVRRAAEPEPVTVDKLPDVAKVSIGARRVVTDANSTTFHAIAVGGGANTVPVFNNGTNWRIG